MRAAADRPVHVAHGGIQRLGVGAQQGQQRRAEHRAQQRKQQAAEKGPVDATDNDGSQRTLKVIYNDQDSEIGEREAASNYQIVTNFVLQPGYYEGVDAKEKKGADRYDRLYEELQATDGVVADEQAAMDILQSVGRRRWGIDDQHSCTEHSAVYNLTK